MKVLFATCATWLLVLVGSRLIRWSDDLENWAGIGDDDLPEGIWIGNYVDPADLKPGGTD